MNLSTPSNPKPQEAKSILLIGPPGGGKTTLMLQFPKLAVLDCDSNLDGPERILRHGLSTPANPAAGVSARRVMPIKPDLTYSHEAVRYKDDGSPRPIEECYDYLLLCLAKLKNMSEIETVAIDSLTFVNEFIIQKVLKEQGGKSVMEPHFWAPFKTKLITLINRLRGLGKTSIMTCHETILTTQDPMKVMVDIIIGYKPAVQSGIGDYFGGFFTDMWRCECNLMPGGYQFMARTMRTKLSELKNSVGLPEAIIDPTYAKLEPYLNGKA